MTTQEENLHLLMRHAGLAPELANESLGGTVVGMLRPYSGLDAAVLGEALNAARSLSESNLDVQTLLQASLAVCELVSVTRAWGLDRDSMLVRNKLIDDAQWVALSEWTRELEEVNKLLLERGLKGHPS